VEQDELSAASMNAVNKEIVNTWGKCLNKNGKN
jgi:hypothetical protein